MRTNNFDPLEYIEKAFLDTRQEDAAPALEELDGELKANVPQIAEYLNGKQIETETIEVDLTDEEIRTKFRKTVMSAPRPRRRKNGVEQTRVIDPQLQAVWEALPKNIEFLVGFFDDSVTANYYRGEFKESRQDLIRRLLDPELTLEETSRLLGVCPATVRRYTNRGWLTHHRTQGGQRRFRLSDVVKFVEIHGRFPQE